MQPPPRERIMVKRSNHYELAFEEYLRGRHVPYVAVDESRRSLLPIDDSAHTSLKNLDFIVGASWGVTWLVDVKGRRFPSGGKQYWKNWSTSDDLVSLARWEQLFGPAARGLYVFAYNIVGDRAPLPPHELFEFRDNLYGFVAIERRDYAEHARPLSKRWATISVPTAKFRELAQPISCLI